MSQNKQELSDSDFIRSFKDEKSRESAYKLIIKKYQERIYWHIRKMVISHEDTNDVMQNTFINMWIGLENFREDSNLYTWIYRVATNECLKFLENKKKLKIISFEDKKTFLENTIKADKHFDPKKLEWQLQLAIQSLPEKQRVIFNLRYYDEMPYEEISRILGTTVGALKASYFHAANKIEDYIKKTLSP